MRLNNWVWLMFALTVAGYWFQQPSAFTAAQTALRLNPSGGPACPPMILDLDHVSTWFCGSTGILGQIGLANLGVAVIIGFMLSLSGFSAVFIIPVIILALILNIFVLPFGFLYTMTDTIPPFISVPVIIMFNLLTVTAMVTFVKGGE